MRLRELPLRISHTLLRLIGAGHAGKGKKKFPCYLIVPTQPYNSFRSLQNTLHACCCTYFFIFVGSWASCKKTSCSSSLRDGIPVKLYIEQNAASSTHASVPTEYPRLLLTFHTTLQTNSTNNVIHHDRPCGWLRSLRTRVSTMRYHKLASLCL